MHAAGKVTGLACMMTIIGGAALAGPDDCTATTTERSAFIGSLIVQQLDRGGGVANYPAWMRDIIGDPDMQGERLERACGAAPEMSLATAIERLHAPDAASK